MQKQTNETNIKFNPQQSISRTVKMVSTLSESALHEVSDGAVGVALFEHEGHEEVRHRLRHVDLNATQQVQIWLATLGEGVVEGNVPVHEEL